MAHVGKEILRKNTLKRKTIEIPEWEGQIVIRELTGSEAVPVNQKAIEIAQSRNTANFDAKKVLYWEAEIFCYGWINEDGSRVLKLEDMDELMETQPRSVIERVAKEIRILTGMERAAPEDPSPKDEAKKNLTEIKSTASGSA